MTKLIDIANELNISVATVSKALNGKGRISSELRKRIKDTAEQMNYHPNEFARTLKTNETTMIGVILPDITNIFYGKLLKGIDRAARHNGYSVMFCNSGENLTHEKYYFEMLRNKNVCGVIIGTSCLSDFYDNLTDDDNVVFVDCLPSETKKFPFVSIDNYKAAYELTEHVLSKGYTDVKMICGPSIETTTKERVRGFVDCMKNHGHKGKRTVFEGDHSFEGGKQVMDKILREGNPQAIITENNFLAFGALSSIRENGLEVPNDVAVACFDGIDEFDTMFIDLTSIIQPVEEIGTTAVEMIMKKIEKTDTHDINQRVLLDYVLNEGESI